MFSKVSWPNFREAFKLIKFTMHQREILDAKIQIYQDNDSGVKLEIQHPLYSATFTLDDGFTFKDIRAAHAALGGK